MLEGIDTQKEENTMPNKKICAEADCGRKHYAKSLCHMHYNKQRRTRPISKKIDTVGDLKAALAFWPDGALVLISVKQVSGEHVWGDISHIVMSLEEPCLIAVGNVVME